MKFPPTIGIVRRTPWGPGELMRLDSHSTYAVYRNDISGGDGEEVATGRLEEHRRRALRAAVAQFEREGICMVWTGLLFSHRFI